MAGIDFLNKDLSLGWDFDRICALRGRSSVGRALHWQCRSREFESHRLHFDPVGRVFDGVFYFSGRSAWD